jgi:GAF domain-containing protein
LAAVTVLLVAVDVVVAAQAVPLTSETAVAVHGFPFVDGAAVGSSLMGALIVARYQRHPIGWLLIAIGVLTSISLLAEAWAYWVQQADGPGSQELGGVAAWVSQLCGGQVVVALIAFLYLLAPDGHFASRRWRCFAVVPATGTLLCVVGIVTMDPTTFDLVNAEDRFGPVRAVIVSIGFILISVGVLLSLVSMLGRLRGSTGEERQQLRLIALSAGLATAGLLVLFVGQAVNGGKQTWVSGVPLFVSFFLMPILFAVAALRYRLYDLDVIINRAVVVAAGTAFAAVGYITSVVVSGRFVEGHSGGLWVSLLATVVVALAFQPLRRMVIRLANRAAYGARAQPYEALADFSRRLSDAPDPDDLLPAVAEAAARAVSARGARATLDVPGGPPVSGTWGWWSTDHEQTPDHEVPVRTEGRELGRIAVALPRGRALQPEDQRLLEALADQTAVAFRNTALAGALADRVAELDRTTRQLAESRVRLIAADDAGRRALEAAIARDVLPFLKTLPDQVGRARAAVDRGADPGLDRLVDGTNEALDALRELTRGVFPTQLARSGLEPTLRSLVARARPSAELDVDLAAGHRYPPRTEAAVYFCCAESLRAGDGPVSVELRGTADELVLRIAGEHDGIDLVGVADRVEAVGGHLTAEPDRLLLRIPVAATAPATPSVLAGDPAGALPLR